MTETSEKLTPEQAELYALEDAGRVVRSLATSGDMAWDFDVDEEPLVRKAMCRIAADLKKRAMLQVCRECACDDADACILPDGTACSWVEADLCSGCAGLANGRPLIEVVSG